MIHSRQTRARSAIGRPVIAGLLLLIQSTQALAGDPTSDVQDRLLARRAAEVDCFRKLAEAVYGVEITSSTYVRDFVAESDEIRSAIETFVKGIRLAAPRYYDDGTCEIDAEVTVADLVTKLTEIHAAYYKGNVVKSVDLTQIRNTLRTSVIRVTGAGVPRAAMPPDLPEGIEDVLTPLPPGYVPPPMLVSAIWRTVGPQARLMAERAARLDAMRRLLERVKGLRLRSDTLVRDFLAESDEVSTHASGLVVGARQVGRYIHPDELIVEVTMELPLEKVVTRLSEWHSDYYRGHHVLTTDITRIHKEVLRKTIRATGSGVAPQRFVNQLARDGIKMPPWIGKRLEATGSGTDAAMETAQGRLRAARAAELNGKRRLAEQVYGLHIDARTTVRDFVSEYGQVLAQVRAVLSNTVTSEPIFEGDVATVTVMLPAAEVWSVVHQHRMILDRHR